MFKNNIHSFSHVHSGSKFFDKLCHETTHHCIVRTMNTFADDIIVFCCTILENELTLFLLKKDEFHTSIFSTTVFPNEHALVVMQIFKLSSELSKLKNPKIIFLGKIFFFLQRIIMI